MIKNIKKLGWLFLIFVISYILLIFTAPQISGVFADFLGLNQFNDFVKGIKSNYDETANTVPTNIEVDNAFDSILETTIDYGSHFKQGLDVTKIKIDGFREDIKEKKKTVQEIKSGYDQVKKAIDTTTTTMQETKKIIDNITEVENTFTNSGYSDDNSLKVQVELQDEKLGKNGIIYENIDTQILTK